MNDSALQAAKMQRMRLRLLGSPSARQRAVAEFPLKVARAAADLKQYCDLRDGGCVVSDEQHEAAKYLEDMIRACYRETFGTELGR